AVVEEDQAGQPEDGGEGTGEQVSAGGDPGVEGHPYHQEHQTDQMTPEQGAAGGDFAGGGATQEVTDAVTECRHRGEHDAYLRPLSSRRRTGAPPGSPRPPTPVRRDRSRTRRWRSPYRAFRRSGPRGDGGEVPPV